MRPESILFFAMAAQILLTLGLMLRLALGRYDEARSGKVDLDRARLDNTVWSEGLTKLSNSVDNQFQTPVLFYAGGLAELHFGPIPSRKVSPHPDPKEPAQEAPRSVRIMSSLPLSRSLVTTFLMSHGARNCAFFTLIGLPVRPAATTKSV